MTTDAPPPDLQNPPQRGLWLTLGIPPVATVAGNLLLACIAQRVEALFVLGVVVVVVVGLILGLAVAFARAAKTRWRGAAVPLLLLAYLVGQVVICVALSMGACMLLFD